jgi:hypothetical protein
MEKMSLLLFLLIPIVSFSQNWAKNNSVWYYNQTNFSTPPNLEYIKYTASKDTVINGDTLKIIFEENLSLKDTISSKIFMKSVNNRVYYYDTRISSYKLIYNFSAKTGDTIEVNCHPAFKNSTIKIHVDSISTIDVNGKKLKVQYVSQIHSEGDEYYMRGKIIENIGWTGFMFPLHAWADPPYGGSLRCFKNDIIGIYKLGNVDCDYITSNKLLNERIEIIIIPNPTNGNINILSENIKSIEIRDLKGNIVYSGKGKIIDLSEKKQGLYLVKVITQDKIQIEKIILSK